MSCVVRAEVWMVALVWMLGVGSFATAADTNRDALSYFDRFCVDCHDGATAKGDVNLESLLEKPSVDRSLVFENLITGKMPPKKKKQPNAEQKKAMLAWLSANQPKAKQKAYRRISRHEFVHSVNDLLGIKLDVVGDIPEDRDTHVFDSNRKILLTRQQLSAYFTAADAMLDFALPAEGFAPEKTWVTNTLMEAHTTYSPYVRKYQKGLLFSWTRANNGNSYSFFYDKFDPPVPGWYDLTFDVAKLGKFKEDVSVIVFAGKYYIADDRPQPQRLLDVISVGHKDVKSHTIRAFLRPGENVSVHCYSKHNWRQKKGNQGAYIEKLTAKGPVFEQWPPTSYSSLFDGVSFKDVSTPQQRRIAVVGDEKQLRQVVRSFADRAFASALSPAETAPYEQLAVDHFKAKGDFVGATKVALKAIVCSHRFLLAPGFHKSESYKRSAALARALWLSVPDQTLLELAAKDALKGDTLKSQIDRMLADRKRDRMIRSFAGQWLNLRSFKKVSPSLKLYPSYGDLLDHYLPLETESYLAHLIQEDLPTSTLIDSGFSILNQRLAQHYGVAGVLGQEMRKVNFAAGSPRGGLMTMGSILKVTTDGTQTSPILRGAWIAKNVAGVTLSPPPEEVEVLEADLSKAQSLKEQIEIHKENKACNACHKSIDPYGFALENFDAIGQWRKNYRIETAHRATFQYRPQGYHKTVGAVDASGDVHGVPFKDVIGLKKIMLTDHKPVAYNFAKKYFEYVNGHKPDLTERIRLHAMIPDDPKASGIRSLMRQVLVDAVTGAKP